MFGDAENIMSRAYLKKKYVYTYIIHPTKERRQFENGVKGAASSATMVPPRGNSHFHFFSPTTSWLIFILSSI